MVFSIEVNWFPVIVASVVSFIIGWLWYGPLFGKTWMKLNKIDMKNIDANKKKGMGKMMILSFIGTLITASVLYILIGNTGVSGIGEGIMLSFWLWLGFLASTTLLGSVLWDNKPWGLFVLNGAYWFVNLIVISLVLTYF